MEKRSDETMLQRGLSILGAFDTQHPDLRLSDLAERSQLALSTTARLVDQLVAWGALVRLESKRYAVGPRIWDLGLLSPVHRELRTVALPFLRDVFIVTRHNVHLAVRDGGSALFVGRFSDPDDATLISEAGSRMPLHASGVGKAMLAHAAEEVVDLTLSEATTLTDRTVVERDELLSQLAQIRERGYAETFSEFSKGVSSIGAPVLAHDGTARAAIGVVTHGSGEDLRRLAPTLQIAARALARRLDPRADVAYIRSQS